MPRLTDDEVRSFLDERGHLARIGTTDADGMPRVLPLWFVLMGDEFLFTPVRRRSSGRTSNVIHEPVSRSTRTRHRGAKWPSRVA